MASSKKAKNWVGTFWLHMMPGDFVDGTTYFQAFIDSGEWTFCAFGEEVAPTSGALHFQTYFSTRNQRSWKTVSADHWGHHIEPMYGSFKDNEVYCSKEGSFIKLGHEPAQGNRTDIEYLVERAKEGVDWMQDIDTHAGTIARSHRFLDLVREKARHARLKTDTTQPEVIACIGAPGIGKTRWFRDRYPDGDVVMFDGKFFNNFTGSDHILIDEMGPGVMPLELFKQISDRYCVPVNIKNGCMAWKPRVLCFTSNYDICEWWKDLGPTQYAAVARRFTEIKKIFPVHQAEPPQSPSLLIRHGEEEVQRDHVRPSDQEGQDLREEEVLMEEEMDQGQDRVRQGREKRHHEDRREEVSFDNSVV